MFLKLFEYMKSSDIPVTIREYLDMLKGLDKGICNSGNIVTSSYCYCISTIEVNPYPS